MRVIIVLIFACCVGMPLAANDEGPEIGHDRGKLTLEQLPEKVRATIIRNARGAKVHEIKRGTQKGVTVYTAEIKDKEAETKIVVDEDGKLVRVTIEKEDH